MNVICRIYFENSRQENLKTEVRETGNRRDKNNSFLLKNRLKVEGGKLIPEWKYGRRIIWSKFVLMLLQKSADSQILAVFRQIGKNHFVSKSSIIRLISGKWKKYAE